MRSGEVESYGVVKAAGIALGYQALLADLGVELPVRVWIDSSATMGICGRQGLGKLRHDGRIDGMSQSLEGGTHQIARPANHGDFALLRGARRE